MSMNRICRLSHPIPVDQDRCPEGHPLAASLKCQINNCNFITDPIHISKIDSAISLLKIHASTVHNPGNNDDVNNEKTDDKVVESDSDDPETNKKTCPICFKIFHSKLNMIRHKKVHHDGSSRHKCNDCSRSFASRTSLNFHINRDHTEDSLISCKECYKQFPDLMTLNIHTESHRSTSGKKLRKCYDCNKILSSSSNLRRHRREVHYSININLGMWEKGMKEQLKVKPFRCPDCQYKTKRKHYLTIHMEQVHIKNLARDFLCNKNFKWKASLEIHKKTAHKLSAAVTEEQESLDDPSEPRDGSTEMSRPEDKTAMPKPEESTEISRPQDSSDISISIDNTEMESPEANTEET